MPTPSGGRCRRARGAASARTRSSCGARRARAARGRARRPRGRSSTPRDGRGRSTRPGRGAVGDDHHVAELGPRAEQPTAGTTPPPTPVPSVSIQVVAPRPAPSRTRRYAAQLASFSISTGSPSRACISSRSGTSRSGTLTAPSATPRAGRSRVGTPKPTARTPSSGSARTTSASSSRSAVCEVVTVGRSTVSCDRSLARRRFRPGSWSRRGRRR